MMRLAAGRLTCQEEKERGGYSVSNDIKNSRNVRIILVGLAALMIATMTSGRASAREIQYRSFSASAAIGPPAQAFATRLQVVTSTVLGTAGEVHLIQIPGIPAIPSKFPDIIAAVAAGQAGGGFDVAYISGGDLNKTWGFIYNSGVPLGPSFDEFLGFLYGKSVGGSETGLELAQEILAARGRGIVALPIVGSPEQLSGYFLEPMDDVRGHRGIGLAGLCQQHWVLRYLPPGEDVINRACDDFVADGRIRSKNISFIEAVPGGGSLLQAVRAGTIQGLEFATPLDDLSQLFDSSGNIGTAGPRFVHTPGWQQQFLITWMIVSKPVWDSLDARQQALFQAVAQAHVASSYGENLRQQGAALQAILDANHGNPKSEIVLSRWPRRDLGHLRAATIRVLNDRTMSPTLPAVDRADYARILEALRLYVHANDTYWDYRQVDPQLRFDDWQSLAGECWEMICDRDYR
jgi:TRAP-type mannitol/chloroaromatic compound transport system substrate-binding protein